MLAHANLLTNAEAALERSQHLATDTMLSWLPYSHIYARTIDLYVTTMIGATVALAESLETLVVNLAEIQPTWMTAVPRFYEKIWTSVEHLPAEERKEKLWRIFGPRLRQLSSGGAPLPKHICRGFFEAGIPLLEGYGLTETSPVISFNSPDDYRIGSVGHPSPSRSENRR
jgi:long-chain acyl-CoA synthetase